MQSLKDKILEGFFTNVGSDPFTYWINEVFKTVNVKSCHSMYIKSKETAEYGEYLYDYNVTKADDNKSLLINSRDPHKKPIIINISDVPELLSIKPNDVLIFYANDEKTGNIKFLFGQFINAREGKDTFINNVLLTIDRKTNTIIDKKVMPKFLISNKTIR